MLFILIPEVGAADLVINMDLRFDCPIKPILGPPPTKDFRKKLMKKKNVKAKPTFGLCPLNLLLFGTSS